METKFTLEGLSEIRTEDGGAYIQLTLSDNRDLYVKVGSYSEVAEYTNRDKHEITSTIHQEMKQLLEEYPNPTDKFSGKPKKIRVTIEVVEE